MMKLTRFKVKFFRIGKCKAESTREFSRRIRFETLPALPGRKLTGRRLERAGFTHACNILTPNRFVRVHSPLPLCLATSGKHRLFGCQEGTRSDESVLASRSEWCHRRPRCQNLLWCSKIQPRWPNPPRRATPRSEITKLTILRRLQFFTFIIALKITINVKITLAAI